MKFITWVKKYCKTHGLEYKEFITSACIQYRVKGEKGFIDFWPNGSFRDIKGEFFRRGASERGYGADNVSFYSSTEDDGCGFLTAIKEEILALSPDGKQTEVGK